MKLSKPFRRQLTHYAEKFLHELLSNISLIKCPTPIGSTKIRPLASCVISLAQYILMSNKKQSDADISPHREELFNIV